MKTRRHSTQRTQPPAPSHFVLHLFGMLSVMRFSHCIHHISKSSKNLTYLCCLKYLIIFGIIFLHLLSISMILSCYLRITIHSGYNFANTKKSHRATSIVLLWTPILALISQNKLNLVKFFVTQ